MPIEIRTTYEFILAQYAAESYLDGINLLDDNSDEFRLRLRNGANHYNHIGNFDLKEIGPTRMTNVMIDDFFDTWEVIDHYPNTNSGFSATVLRHKKTGEFTLSFRSTESKDMENGGDKERDSYGANLQIAFEGFAYGQLLDMEEYYKHLKKGESWNGEANGGKGAWEVNDRLNGFKNHIAAEKDINVTGYSLGGHLAQVFTQMHHEDVIHTYTFNGAGMGAIDDASTGTEIGSATAEKLELLKNVLQNPFLYLGEVSTFEFVEIGYPLGSEFNAKEEALNRLMADRLPHYDNVYDDPLYKYALHVLPDDTTSGFSIEVSELLTSETPTADSKVTNIYGDGADFDLEIVAGAGRIFGDFEGVFIEDQFLGKTHSITLLADSLATMDLFQSIDSNLSSDDINEIFSASSNLNTDKALIKVVIDFIVNDDVLGLDNFLDKLGVTDESYRTHIKRAINSLNGNIENLEPIFEILGLDIDSVVVESDPLENALNALGKIFLKETWIDSLIDPKLNGFKNLQNRNEFYDNIKKLRERIFDTNGQKKLEFQNLELGIVSLIGKSQDELIDNAKNLMSYRYALKELNPFVIKTNSAASDTILYEPHNQYGELDFFNEVTGKGLLTSRYIEDRSLFLVLKNVLSKSNNTILQKAEEDARFYDLDSQLELITNHAKDFSRENYIFGSERSDGRIDGAAFGDHIYGGDGIEVIYGLAGNDYIEGNLDDDDLFGGDGSDTLLGGKDNDTLYGGNDDSTDDGVMDTLNGGDGNDTYYIGKHDQVIDSDGLGVLKLIMDNGSRVTLSDKTYYALGDGVYQAENDDKIRLELKSNGTLDVHVTTKLFSILNFTTGDFGITLSPEEVTEPSKIYQVPDNHFETTVVENNINTGITGPFELILGNNNNTHQLNNTLDVDEQILINLSPGITVRGGEGNDSIIVDGAYTGFIVDPLDYEPLVSGEPGNIHTGVTVDGQAGNDLIRGGLDNDVLIGGSGRDLLVGYDGQDTLHGGDGDDTLLGVDTFFGRNQTEGTSFLVVDGNDLMIGGRGRDFIADDWGNDTAIGGEDDDLITVGSGTDTVYGGSGNDVIYGDGYFVGRHGKRDWTLSYDGLGRIQNVTYNGDFTQFNIVAQGGADYIDGGEGQDAIHGGVGDDTLIGGNGHDVIHGDEDNDVIDGEDGNDLLFGDHGLDTIQGGKGNDEVYGGDGNDFIEGGDDSDFLYGGTGDDELLGDAGVDYLFGGADNDTLSGGGENDQLYGEAGNDILNGGAGVDYLHGGDDDDILDGDAGADFLYGGAGIDTLIVGEGDTVDGGQGDDIYQIENGANNVTILDANGSDTIEFAEGITFSDLIINRSNGNIIIDTGSSTVTINDWDSNRIERLLFSDGSEIIGDAVEEAINDAPSADVRIAEYFTNEDDFLSFTLPENTFSDPENNISYFTARLANGNALPDWLSLDSEKREFFGTPKNANVGSIELIVTAVDKGGLTATSQFTLSVNNTNDAPEAVVDIVELVSYEDSPYIGGQVLPVMDIDIDYTSQFLIDEAIDGTYTVEVNDYYYQPVDEYGYSTGAPSYNYDVVQRFDQYGNPGNSSILGNASIHLENGHRLILDLPDGNSANSTYGQLYDQNDTAITGQFHINDIGQYDNFSRRPDAASLNNGNLVVIWSEQSGNNSSIIKGRVFNSSGAKVGGHFQISSDSSETNNYTDAKVIANSNGGFMVISEVTLDNTIGNDQAIVAQSFDENGYLLANRFTLASYLDGAANISHVDIKQGLNGEYLVAWSIRDRNNTPNDYSDDVKRNFIQKFNSDGSLNGNVLEYNINTTSRIDWLSDGNFITVWSEFDDNFEIDIYSQFFDQDMNPQGVVQQVQHGAGTNPHVVGLADAGYHILWSDSNGVLQGRKFVTNSDQISVEVDVLANDFDIDIDDDVASLKVISANVRGVDQGTVTIINNKLVYEPGTEVNNFTEISSIIIDYTIEDSSGAQSTTTTTIIIRGEDVVPTGTNDDDVINVDDTQPIINAGAGDDIIHVSDTTVPVIIYGGEGNDTINVSAENDVTVFGDEGVDNFVIDLDEVSTSATTVTYTLYGGKGADNYFISGSTSANVVIHIQDPDGVNKFIFDDSFNPNNVILSLGSLKLSFDNNQVEIHLEQFDANDVYSNVRDISLFEFSNVTLTYEQLVARGFDLIGTSDSDTISGTNINDRIEGLNGDDQIYGGEGDDRITGGTGNDFLDGGVGNDTYIYNIGDGKDVIDDRYGQDNILFGDGIDTSTLQFDKLGNDLLIIISETDQVTVKNWFENNSRHIEQFNLIDGSQFLSEDVADLINIAPELNQPISDQVFSEDSPFSFTLNSDTFIDSNIDDVLSYSATLHDGTQLPSWLNFDATTSTFSGTPDNNDVGEIDIKVTATDTSGLSVSDEFSLLINNVNDAPELALNIPDHISDENQALSFTLPENTFVDEDEIHGDTLTYSISSALPNWLNFDANTQTFSGTSGFADAGDHAITITATDSSGLSVSDTFSISINVPGATLGTDNDDVLNGGHGNDTLLGLGGNDTINGGNNHDRLAGGSGNDNLYGGNGDDQLIGGTGNDNLNGGNHEDFLDGGDGDDTLIGSNGKDTLLGGSGNDELNGGNQDDVLDAGRGDDVLIGSNGADLLYGREGNDILDGGNQNDLLDGGTGNDQLDGGNGNDTLIGGNGDDVIEGGNGNDLFDGGYGNDHMEGGNGNDIYQFNRHYGHDSIREQNGNDKVNFADVNHNNLWFWQEGNDLNIGVLGTDDKLTIEDWYSNHGKKVERFNTSDDSYVLLERNVQQLVDAMAVFDTSQIGTLDVPQQIQDEMQSVITTSWQAA